MKRQKWKKQGLTNPAQSVSLMVVLESSIKKRLPDIQLNEVRLTLLDNGKMLAASNS